MYLRSEVQPKAVVEWVSKTQSVCEQPSKHRVTQSWIHVSGVFRHRKVPTCFVG